MGCRNATCVLRARAGPLNAENIDRANATTLVARDGRAPPRTGEAPRSSRACSESPNKSELVRCRVGHTFCTIRELIELKVFEDEL